jgi:phage tail tube protein FII
MNSWPAFLVSEQSEDADSSRLLVVLQQDLAEIEAGSAKTGASKNRRQHQSAWAYCRLQVYKSFEGILH